MTYAFASADHVLYAYGTPDEAERFAEIMRIARPYTVRPMTEADLAALRPGTRILKLSLSLETPL